MNPVLPCVRCPLQVRVTGSGLAQKNRVWDEHQRGPHFVSRASHPLPENEQEVPECSRVNKGTSFSLWSHLGQERERSMNAVGRTRYSEAASSSLAPSPPPPALPGEAPSYLRAKLRDRKICFRHLTTLWTLFYPGPQGLHLSSCITPAHSPNPVLTLKYSSILLSVGK